MSNLEAISNKKLFEELYMYYDIYLSWQSIYLRSIDKDQKAEAKHEAAAFKKVYQAREKEILKRAKKDTYKN